FLASTLAKAPPLPGLTWLALVTTHRPPFTCRTMPGLMVLPLIFIGVSEGGGRSRRRRAERPQSLEDDGPSGNPPPSEAWGRGTARSVVEGAFPPPPSLEGEPPPPLRGPPPPVGEERLNAPSPAPRPGSPPARRRRWARPA